MKLAVVAIAAEFERNYIREWVSYHSKLGFDVFVYSNNWDFECAGAIVERIDGECQQLIAYNRFIIDHSSEYDWVLAIDCDEFFYPNIFENAEKTFRHYGDCAMVAFNWVLFGDSGLAVPDPDNMSVPGRFVRCQRVFNRHVKTAVNLALAMRSGSIRRGVFFNNPHCTAIDCVSDVKVGSDRSCFVRGPFNDSIAGKDVAGFEYPYIAHYFCKTRNEYVYRRSFGKADFYSYVNGVKNEDRWYPDGKFDEYNFNDIENKGVSDLLKKMK